MRDHCEVTLSINEERTMGRKLKNNFVFIKKELRRKLKSQPSKCIKVEMRRKLKSKPSKCIRVEMRGKLKSKPAV